MAGLGGRCARQSTWDGSAGGADSPVVLRVSPPPRCVSVVPCPPGRDPEAPLPLDQGPAHSAGDLPTLLLSLRLAPSGTQTWTRLGEGRFPPRPSGHLEGRWEMDGRIGGVPPGPSHQDWLSAAFPAAPAWWGGGSSGTGPGSSLCPEPSLAVSGDWGSGRVCGRHAHLGFQGHKAPREVMIPEVLHSRFSGRVEGPFPRLSCPDRDWGASPGHVSPGLRPVSKAPSFKNSVLPQGYLL